MVTELCRYLHGRRFSCWRYSVTHRSTHKRWNILDFLTTTKMPSLAQVVLLCCTHNDCRYVASISGQLFIKPPIPLSTSPRMFVIFMISSMLFLFYCLFVGFASQRWASVLSSTRQNQIGYTDGVSASVPDLEASCCFGSCVAPPTSTPCSVSFEQSKPFLQMVGIYLSRSCLNDVNEQDCRV